MVTISGPGFGFHDLRVVSATFDIGSLEAAVSVALRQQENGSTHAYAPFENASAIRDWRRQSHMTELTASFKVAAVATNNLFFGSAAWRRCPVDVLPIALATARIAPYLDRSARGLTDSLLGLILPESGLFLAWGRSGCALSSCSHLARSAQGHRRHAGRRGEKMTSSSQLIGGRGSSAGPQRCPGAYVRSARSPAIAAFARAAISISR